MSTSRSARATCQRPLPLAPNPIAFQADLNGVEQVLVAEGLGQKLDGAPLHRLHGHRDVAMPGDKDDGSLDVGGQQLALKVETAATGQAYVQDEAGRSARQ